MKPLADIYFEINNSNTLQELIDIWNYIASNKHQYALNDIWNVNKEIRLKTYKISEKDKKELESFRIKLKNQIHIKKVTP